MDYRQLLEVKRDGFYTFVNRHCINTDTAEIIKRFTDRVSTYVGEHVYQIFVDLVVEPLDDKIDEITERYCTSVPVSGDWSTELAHERRALIEELDIPESDADWILVNLLGFSKEEVEQCK